MRTPAPDLLVAATNRRWIAEHLATSGRVPVVFDHGLDAPELGDRTAAWWTPTEHAARLRHAGVPFAPQAPGPAWLADLDAELTGRTIWAGRLGDTAGPGLPDAGWWKLAETKHPDLPAGWHDSATAFAAAAYAAAIGDDSWVQVTASRLRLTAEYRMFIADRQVAGGSWYLAGNHTWDPDHTPDEVDVASAAAYAHDVVTALGSGQPDGYVLDVARTDDRWLVLEGNPCWSANPYGTPADAVVASVLAAFTRPGWAWDPDPYLLTYAARRPLLRRSRPVWLDHLEDAGVVRTDVAATVTGDLTNE